ncbi:MAG: TolC family protein [Gemmataceae bacterium]|nr:TolC family protein [Gemmataceae bacterium]
MLAEVARLPCDRARSELWRVPLHEARSERLRALGNGALGVLEAERQLRLLIGLPPEDGTRLIPADTPTVAQYEPSWTEAVQEALALRPELVQRRQEVTVRELSLYRDRNSLLPDLRFLSNYNVNGLGTRLDGNDPSGALHSLGENRFHDWTLGLRLDVPIGFRDAHANVRRDELLLRRAQVSLRDQEEQIVFELERSFRQVIEGREQVRLQQGRLNAARVELEGRFRGLLAGQGIVQIYLISLQKWVDALRDDRVATSDYNVALADFQRQKGSILQYDNVTIGEGPLPTCAMERASEHLRERHNALMLLQRPLPPVRAPAEMAAPDRKPIEGPPAPGREAPAEELPLPRRVEPQLSLSQLLEQPPVPKLLPK